MRSIWMRAGYFGLNPALAPLQSLWEQRQTGIRACVRFAGHADAFTFRCAVITSNPKRRGAKVRKTAGMNRLLAGLPGSVSPTRAVSIGPLMPRILSGRMRQPSNIASGSGGIPSDFAGSSANRQCV